jgi:uncharacterized protein (TIGR02265 family)
VGTEQRVVYESVMEGLLLRAVGKRMTPALKAKLKELGVDLDQRLKAQYSAELFEKVVALLCTTLYPALSRDEALFKLGSEIVDGYADTLFGKVLMQMMKVLGPRRTLERLPQSYRGGNNFTDVKLTAKGPREYEMWMNEVGDSAQFVRGGIIGVLTRAGGKQVEVKPSPGQGAQGTFHITWND